MSKRTATTFFLAAAFAAISVGACSDASSGDYAPPPVTLDEAGAGDASNGGGDGSTTGPGQPKPIPDKVSCTTTFTYTPPAGRIVSNAAVTGEWNNFDPNGVALQGPAQDGSFTGTMTLPAGLVAYKLVLNGNQELDPMGRLRKYVNGVENSAIRVPDCHIPQLALADKSITRAAQGQGHFTATVAYVDSADGKGIDPKAIQVTLRKDGAESPLTAKVTTTATGAPRLAIDVPNLADGKYTIFVDAADKRGAKVKAPLRLVFWVEAEAFDWRDAVIYMTMTDRFKDGDTSNDAAPTPGVDPRAVFKGGDFEGVRQVVASGALDQLGIRAIWLSPFHQNPAGSYPAADGQHQMTGYHGYWPIRARQVEPRLGTPEQLKALVKEAHAHGIRVLQDFVVNHVHKEHEYFTAHPEWFRTGCVCGTDNCDWTVHRLDCLFATYLPDVNWTVPEVHDQWGDDAVWWLDTFDIDGLRIDAVKHVEDAATINLSARLRDEFEAAGTRLFMTGETAMGWSDCDLSCNQSQYDTISRYIVPDQGPYQAGPGGLDGQFDFVLYYASPMQAFVADHKDMHHVDYWTQASGWEYPKNSIMTSYIGSQDTARSVSIATYRGQDSAHDGSIPGNQWDNVAQAPTDSEPYARHRVALSWLLTTPGAPMVYYGDEYGEWGGSDPNNRAMWRGDGTLDADEQATLAWARKLGQARKSLPALRRGVYEPFTATTSTVLVFGRKTDDGQSAIVLISKDTSQQAITAPLPTTIPLADGTVLHDRLGGPDVTVSGGAITATVPPRGAVILAP